MGVGWESAAPLSRALKPPPAAPPPLSRRRRNDNHSIHVDSCPTLTEAATPNNKGAWLRRGIPNALRRFKMSVPSAAANTSRYEKSKEETAHFQREARLAAAYATNLIQSRGTFGARLLEVATADRVHIRDVPNKPDASNFRGGRGVAQVPSHLASGLSGDAPVRSPPPHASSSNTVHEALAAESDRREDAQDWGGLDATSSARDAASTGNDADDHDAGAAVRESDEYTTPASYSNIAPPAKPDARDGVSVSAASTTGSTPPASSQATASRATRDASASPEAARDAVAAIESARQLAIVREALHKTRAAGDAERARSAAATEKLEAELRALRASLADAVAKRELTDRLLASSRANSRANSRRGSVTDGLTGVNKRGGGAPRELPPPLPRAPARPPTSPRSSILPLSQNAQRVSELETEIESLRTGHRRTVASYEQRLSRLTAAHTAAVDGANAAVADALALRGDVERLTEELLKVGRSALATAARATEERAAREAAEGRAATIAARLVEVEDALYALKRKTELATSRVVTVAPLGGPTSASAAGSTMQSTALDVAAATLRSPTSSAIRLRLLHSTQSSLVGPPADTLTAATLAPNGSLRGSAAAQGVGAGTAAGAAASALGASVARHSTVGGGVSWSTGGRATVRVDTTAAVDRPPVPTPTRTPTASPLSSSTTGSPPVAVVGNATTPSLSRRSRTRTRPLLGEISAPERLSPEAEAIVGIVDALPLTATERIGEPDAVVRSRAAAENAFLRAAQEGAARKAVEALRPQTAVESSATRSRSRSRMGRSYARQSVIVPGRFSTASRPTQSARDSLVDELIANFHPAAIIGGAGWGGSDGSVMSKSPSERAESGATAPSLLVRTRFAASKAVESSGHDVNGHAQWLHAAPRSGGGPGVPVLIDSRTIESLNTNAALSAAAAPGRPLALVRPLVRAPPVPPRYAGTTDNGAGAASLPTYPFIPTSH